MLLRLAADLLVCVHAAFVLFVVLGGLLILWRRAFLWLHPPAALWGFLVEARGWICPLTEIENGLRQRAGEAGYAGGFVEHYLIPILYPAGLTRDLQGILAAFVVIANLSIYVLVWRRLRGGGGER